jgi:hypothetical protein
MGILPMYRGMSEAAFGKSAKKIEGWSGVEGRFTGWKPVLRG